MFCRRPGSVPSRAMSERPGPMSDGGIPVYPLTPHGSGSNEAFRRVTLDHGHVLPHYLA